MTTDFKVWIEDVEPNGVDDIYSLHKAASERTNCGRYEVSVKGEMTFIKADGEKLELLSEKARQAFLKDIDKLKGDPEMSMEAWYQFHRAMQKDD